MTFQRYVFKNAFRNKRRTALTVLSIGFSLFLLITLQTMLETLLNPDTGDDSALRIAVRRSTSLADQMPLSYQRKIEDIPGVKLVIPLQWFGGIYIEPENFFANFATDPEKVWDVYSDYEIAPETVEAMKKERIAAVAGEVLREKFGWKVGDRITLKSGIFGIDLEFKLVGFYNAKTQANVLYFRHDYLNESLDKPNTVGAFWVQASSTGDVPRVIEAIDAKFRNSSAETKSDTEKAFVLGFVEMLGDVKTLITSITSVVLITMLLVCVSTMAMAIRERYGEVGVLKSIGYTSKVILFLVIGEAVFVAMLGAGIGCAGAWAMGMLNLGELSQGYLEGYEPSFSIMGVSVAIGLGIGFVSGLIPAIQVSRMTITEALRQID